MCSQVGDTVPLPKPRMWGSEKAPYRGCHVGRNHKRTGGLHWRFASEGGVEGNAEG